MEEGCKVIVDINALVEQRMLARWRTLLPRAPPTPPMAPVEWDTSYSDVPRGMTEEETHHDDDEEKELLLMLLVDSFLEAVPHQATELVHYYLRVAADIDGDMVSRGGGALHLEAVCLSDWVFASSGPHACLSFLDPHHEHDHDNDVDAVDKQALFAWLGRTLVSVNSKRVWQDLHAAGGSHRIASQLVARLWQALSLLAQTVQAHAHESRTRGRVEDTEQTALVLIECLHFLSGILSSLHGLDHHSGYTGGEIASGLLEQVVQLSANVAVDGCMELVVRNAALRCLLAWLRDHAIGASPDDRAQIHNHIKELLSLAEPHEPAVIRCLILQALPRVCLPTDYRDLVYANTSNLLPVEYTNVALAAATCSDERIAIAATLGIEHLAICRDTQSYTYPVDALMSHWHVLVDNVVRPGDNVHSLLRMAAKQVAQSISRGDPTSSEWRCLPDELAEVVDTFLRKEREKRQTYATQTKKVWTLRTASIRALTAICNVCVLDKNAYALLESKMNNEQWQNREAGLLVLHCVIGALVVVGPQGVGFNGSEQHTELWRLTVTLLTDPRAKVQKAAAHALISIAPFLPRVLRKSAAEQLVLVLLYDAKTSTRRKAFLALNAWSWTSQPKWHANVLEACGQHQQSLLDGLSPSVRELGLLTGACDQSRWLMLLHVMANSAIALMKKRAICNGRQDVVMRTISVLQQSLEAVRHHADDDGDDDKEEEEEEARTMHAEALTQMLRAISMAIVDDTERHGDSMDVATIAKVEEKEV